MSKPEGWSGDQKLEVLYTAVKAAGSSGMPGGVDCEQHVRLIGKMLYPQFDWVRFGGGSYGPALTVLKDRGLLTNVRSVWFIKKDLSPETLRKLLVEKTAFSDWMKGHDPRLLEEVVDFLITAKKATKIGKRGLPSADGILNADVSTRFRQVSHLFDCWLIELIGMKKFETVDVALIEAMEVNHARLEFLTVEDGRYKVSDLKKVPPSVANIHGQRLILTARQELAMSLAARLKARFDEYFSTIY